MRTAWNKLPQLGELLAKGNLKQAAPFMSACVIVTQLVIMVSAVFVANQAQKLGRKPLLVLGFAPSPFAACCMRSPPTPGR